VLLLAASLTAVAANNSRSGINILDDRPARKRCDNARRVTDYSEMGCDIIERAFLFARARRRATIAWNDDFITVEKSVVDRRADADIRHDAEHNQLIDKHIL
jgi:hypothetical protein